MRRILGMLTILAQGVLGWGFAWPLQWAPSDILQGVCVLALLVLGILSFSAHKEDRKWVTFLALIPTVIHGFWEILAGEISGGVLLCTGGVLWGVGTSLLLKAD